MAGQEGEGEGEREGEGEGALVAAEKKGQRRFPCPLHRSHS